MMIFDYLYSFLLIYVDVLSKDIHSILRSGRQVMAGAWGSKTPDRHGWRVRFQVLRSPLSGASAEEEPPGRGWRVGFQDPRSQL